MIAYGRPGGGIDLQDIRTGTAHVSLAPGDTTVKPTCLAISPDGLFVACSSPGFGWDMFDMSTTRKVASGKGHDQRGACKCASTCLIHQGVSCTCTTEKRNLLTGNHAGDFVRARGRVSTLCVKLRHDERRLASVKARASDLRRMVASPTDAQDEAANLGGVHNRQDPGEQRLEAALLHTAELEKRVQVLREELHRVAAVVQQAEINPQPSTLNPQPSTLNPQPSTLNP